MQTVSAQLTAACSDYGQRPCVYVEFSWDRTGSILGARGAAGWTNETAALKSDSGELAINPPGERLVPAGSVGSARIDLWNQTFPSWTVEESVIEGPEKIIGIYAGRYSWQNVDSALYAYIGEANSPAGPVGTPVRIWRGYLTRSASPWTVEESEIEGSDEIIWPGFDGRIAEYVCVFTGVVAEWKENPDFTVSFGLRDWGWVYMQNRLDRAVERDQLASEWIETVATAAGITAGEMALDVGVFPIPYTWMDKEGAVDEIWTAAEADGGLALFDQTGKLLYWNPLHWIGSPVVWTFGEDGYSLSEPETDIRNLATEVTVEWSPRFESVDADLYNLDEVRVLMPGETATWDARFRYAAVAIHALDPEDPYNDYYAVSAGGANLTDDVTITLLHSYGQSAEVQAVNNSATAAARLTYLRIRGRPLVGGPNEEVTVTVTPAPLPFSWQRSLRSNTSAGQGPWSDRVQGNVYLQTKAQGQALAELLAVRCRRVRPIWSLRQVWGIPQLELGDRVQFVDTRSQGSGGPVEALVIGISWGDGGAGYIQTLRLLEIGDLAEYDDYFIIGVSSLGGSAGDNHGRLWY